MGRKTAISPLKINGNSGLKIYQQQHKAINFLENVDINRQKDLLLTQECFQRFSTWSLGHPKEVLQARGQKVSKKRKPTN